jgi:hypothetical protein
MFAYTVYTIPQWLPFVNTDNLLSSEVRNWFLKEMPVLSSLFHSLKYLHPKFPSINVKFPRCFRSKSNSRAISWKNSECEGVVARA